MPGTISPPQVATGMSAAFAAAMPAPIEVLAKANTKIASTFCTAKVLIAAFAWSALACVSTTLTSHPAAFAASVAPAITAMLSASLARSATIPRVLASRPVTALTKTPDATNKTLSVRIRMLFTAFLPDRPDASESALARRCGPSFALRALLNCDRRSRTDSRRAREEMRESELITVMAIPLGRTDSLLRPSDAKWARRDGRFEPAPAKTRRAAT